MLYTVLCKTLIYLASKKPSGLKAQFSFACSLIFSPVFVPDHVQSILRQLTLTNESLKDNKKNVPNS